MFEEVLLAENGCVRRYLAVDIRTNFATLVPKRSKNDDEFVGMSVLNEDGSIPGSETSVFLRNKRISTKGRICWAVGSRIKKEDLNCARQERFEVPARSETGPLYQWVLV